MFDVNSVNESTTKEGSWGEFGGGKFLIAHTSNLDFQREFNRLQRPYRKKLDKGNLDPKVANDIMCEAMSKFLLLNWSNVGSDGKDIKYSKDTAFKVLKSNEDLREFVQDFSMDLDNYRLDRSSTEGKS